MTKTKLVMTAAAMWAGGFAATAALAYVVQHPAAAPTTAIAGAMPTWTELVPIAEVPAPEPERIIVLPTVEIVGTVTPAVVTPPPRPRDISEMHCSDWKPLEQGSNSVRLCE
jgi:hypothetical protein